MSSSKKRLRDSSITTFFNKSTKEAVASRAFNDQGISSSSGGIILDLTKNKAIIEKNPVGRPPKKLNQSTLPIPHRVELTEDQICEKNEVLVMHKEDLFMLARENECLLMGNEDRLVTESPKTYTTSYYYSSNRIRKRLDSRIFRESLEQPNWKETIYRLVSWMAQLILEVEE